MPSTFIHSVILFCLLAYSSNITAEVDVERAIGVIRLVGPGAVGSREARAARDQLALQGVEILPRLLVAMDTPNIVAANWYRTAFDAISERALAQSNILLPRNEIETFVHDPNRTGRSRRLGFALLERIDPKIRDAWMPGLLEDPEFRRDAVDHTLRSGDRAKNETAIQLAIERYELAFRNARDGDQVLAAVSRLKGVGKKVDPVAHLGFVTRWWLVGPFPAEQTSGFRLAFPPEKQVDLSAEYDVAEGRKLRWKLHQTTASLGEVDLIQAVEPVREAVAYAYAELDVPREQKVQLRCSADDNLSVWLNGSQVLAREQWLNGTRLDRFITPVALPQGTSRVLVKICQGPQHVNPEVPNNWTFQLRFCDESGAAAEFRNLLPPIH